MSIVLARIDNRLIHGQVLETWVPSLGADCLVVANDKIATDSFQKLIMESAVPSGIKVMIGSFEQVGEFLAANESKYRILLLFESSVDALRAPGFGIEFSCLNLGNMHGGTGKKRLSCTIALDKEDVGNFEALEQRGVKITAQCIPVDRERDWRQLLVNSGVQG